MIDVASEQRCVVVVADGFVSRPSIEQPNSRQLQKDFIEETAEVGRGSSRL